MNREVADIQDLKSAFISHCRALGCEDNYIKVCENKFDRIEASINIQKKMVESLQSSKEHLIDDLEKLERENFELSERVGFNATYKGEDDEKLKAFEIIKNKQVNVYNFIWYHEHHKWLNYEKYCEILDLPEEDGCDDTFELQEFCKQGERLTQEEYELLKKELIYE